MTEDRRAWDPFAPPPPPPAAAAPATLAAHAPVATSGLLTSDPPPDGLDDLRKPELIALAQERELESSGTRADIIARLRDAQG